MSWPSLHRLTPLRSPPHFCCKHWVNRRTLFLNTYLFIANHLPILSRSFGVLNRDWASIVKLCKSPPFPPISSTMTSPTFPHQCAISHPRDRNGPGSSGAWQRLAAGATRRRSSCWRCCGTSGDASCRCLGMRFLWPIDPIDPIVAYSGHVGYDMLWILLND